MTEGLKDQTANVPIWNDWYKDTKFTTDWSSRAFPKWDAKLSDLRNNQLDILEVGCWEGRGTIFLLNYFINSRVTAADLFMFGNEGLFDINVVNKYSNRVRKLAGRSAFILDRLATREKRTFDLIYLDGSHDTDDVMIDSLLAWRLLKVGGTMIWDDYKLVEAMPGCFNEYQNPKPAIDVFLQWKDDEYEIIDIDYQVIVRKTKAHYEVPSTLMDPLAPSRSILGE